MGSKLSRFWWPAGQPGITDSVTFCILAAISKTKTQKPSETADTTFLSHLFLIAGLQYDTLVWMIKDKVRLQEAPPTAEKQVLSFKTFENVLLTKKQKRVNLPLLERCSVRTRHWRAALSSRLSGPGQIRFPSPPFSDRRYKKREMETVDPETVSQWTGTR